MRDATSASIACASAATICRPLLRLGQQGLVVDIADDSRPRTALRELRRAEARGNRRNGAASGRSRNRPADFRTSRSASVGGRSHLLREREVGEHARTEPSGSLDRPSPALFSRAARPCGLRVGSNIGKRIDGRPARKRVGRAVDMEREIDARTKPPGDRRHAGRE